MDTLDSRAMALFARALDQPSAQRRDWLEAEAAGDQELLARALSLLNADANLAGAIRTGGAARTAGLLSMPQQIGAYRVTGLIGEGGMGAVLKAERDAGDFDHTVAIKVIRPGILSDTMERRFREERQLLARLNHPHIARLFDGGALPDGSPYIVMEFVDGTPILNHIRDRDLDVRARIGLFRDVCSAVGHAHQNLVIHRDITPSNVLVTRTGSAKLIDFGISRPQEEADPAALRAGASLSFTPGYAAPERSTGAPATTLTDIFSLGRLLGDILAGTPADADLAAIAAKAGAEDPQARYPSADALIEDLDRWRELRPVHARGQDAAYQFGKYLRRRKGLVAGLSLGFIALTSAFAVTFVQYTRAEVARREASQRFDDLRALAGTMMTEVYGAIERVPGTTLARQKLVEAAQSYLDRLAVTPGAPRDLRLETADGFTRLGQIYASPKGFSLGMTDQGLAAFARARAILEAELAATPDDAALLLQAGKHFFYESEVAVNPLNDYDRALELLDRSEALLQHRLDLLGPQDEPGLISLIYTRSARGDVFVMRGQYVEAASLYETSVAQTDALVAARAARGDPPDGDLLRLNNSAYRVLGQVYTYQGRHLDAVAALDKAIALYPAIEAIALDDTFALRGKTLAYGRRAFALRLSGEFGKALADYEVALQISQERVLRDPADDDAERMLMIYKGETAAVLDSLGRHQEADALFGETLAYHRRQLEAGPDVPARLRNLWIQYYLVAQHHRAANDESAACDAVAEMAELTTRREAVSALTDPDRAAWADVLAEFSACRG